MTRKSAQIAQDTMLKLMAGYLMLDEKARSVLLSALDGPRAGDKQTIMVTTRFSPTHELWQLLEPAGLIEYVPVSHEVAQAATLGARITVRGMAELPELIAMAERSRDPRITQVTKH